MGRISKIYFGIGISVAVFVAATRVYTGAIGGLALSAHIRNTLVEGAGWPILIPIAARLHFKYPAVMVHTAGGPVRVNMMHAARLLFPYGYWAPPLMGTRTRTRLMTQLGVIIKD